MRLFVSLICLAAAGMIFTQFINSDVTPEPVSQMPPSDVEPVLYVADSVAQPREMEYVNSYQPPRTRMLVSVPEGTDPIIAVPSADDAQAEVSSDADIRKPQEGVVKDLPPGQYCPNNTCPTPAAAGGVVVSGAGCNCPNCTCVDCNCGGTVSYSQVVSGGSTGSYGAYRMASGGSTGSYGSYSSGGSTGSYGSYQMTSGGCTGSYSQPYVQVGSVASGGSAGSYSAMYRPTLREMRQQRVASAVRGDQRIGFFQRFFGFFRR